MALAWFHEATALGVPPKVEALHGNLTANKPGASSTPGATF